MTSKSIQCYYGAHRNVQCCYGIEQFKKMIEKYGMPTKMWLVLRDEDYDVIKSDILPASLTIRQIQKRFIEY